MIDIVRVKQTLNDYLKKYDINDEQIKLKISHTYRVAELSKLLGKSLNLPEIGIDLAETIGLLHDIGRFEQVKRYHTFLDKDSVNHGELGIEILFEDNLIRKFIEDSRYDDIIKESISNHNREKITDGITGLELLHSKIIRDSDKTDILYLSSLKENIDVAFCQKDLVREKITDKVYYDFVTKNRINYNSIKSGADIVLCHLAYIFDYNYDYLLRYVYEKEYIDKIFDMIEFKDEESQDKFYSCYQITKTYMKRRI